MKKENPQPKSDGPNSRESENFGPATLWEFFRGTHLKTTVILLYAAFALTFWIFLPPSVVPTESPVDALVLEAAGPLPGYPESVENALKSYADPADLPLSVFLTGERKIFAAFLLMGLIPILIVKFLFHERLTDYGLGFGNFFTLRSMILFTPLMILLAYGASFNPKFYLVYPFNHILTNIFTNSG